MTNLSKKPRDYTAAPLLPQCTQRPGRACRRRRRGRLRRCQGQLVKRCEILYAANVIPPTTAAPSGLFQPGRSRRMRFMTVKKNSPLPAVQGFLARRLRLRPRTRAHPEAQVQELRDVSPAARPHACDDLREEFDAHASVVRSRHLPARRPRGVSQHARHATRTRRADRGRGASHLAHGRHHHDPHVRPGDHRSALPRIRACR